MFIEDYYPRIKFYNTKRKFHEIPLYEPVPQKYFDKSRVVKVVLRSRQRDKYNVEKTTIRFRRYELQHSFSTYLHVGFSCYNLSNIKEFENKEDVRAELFEFINESFDMHIAKVVSDHADAAGAVADLVKVL